MLGLFKLLVSQFYYSEIESNAPSFLHAAMLKREERVFDREDLIGHALDNVVSSERASNHNKENLSR